MYWTSLGLVYVIAVVCMSLAPESPTDVLHFPGFDKVLHFSVYTFMMLWFGQIYHERPVPFLIASALVMLGILLEVLQGLGGYRMFDYTDIAANTIGVASGFCIARTRFGGLLHAFEIFLARSGY